MKRISVISVLCGIVFFAVMMAETAQAQDIKRTAITVQGATTVASLIGPWAAQFEEGKNGFSVVVYGSTHGKGLEALLNKWADVAMLARNLSPAEKEEAAKKGTKLEEVFLGYDAIAIIVNPANPVNQLTLDQLRNIFTGRYTSWKDVGGPDHPIEVITLPPDSGMVSFMSKSVLKADFAPHAQVTKSVTSAPKIVQGRQWAISFCREDLGMMGHREGTLKVMRLQKDNSTPAEMPTHESVANGTYPIVRQLLLAYDAQAAEERVKRFVDFCQAKAVVQSEAKMLGQEKALAKEHE